MSTTASASASWSQFCYVALGSCYLQEEKLQIIKIFTTCVKKLKMFSNFLREKGPYTKSEGWKRRQYFFSASASCLNGPLLEEKIKGSSVEIDVNELSLPGETT